PSALKCLLIKFLANTTETGEPVYWLKVLTFTYSIFGPTANAELLGNVQGVVVQAIKATSSSAVSTSVLINGCTCDLSIRNSATIVVSFTSLYVPGWLSSCELNPVPAAGE